MGDPVNNVNIWRPLLRSDCPKLNWLNTYYITLLPYTYIFDLLGEITLKAKTLDTASIKLVGTIKYFLTSKKPVYICWLNLYLGRHLKNQAICKFLVIDIFSLAFVNVNTLTTLLASTASRTSTILAGFYC